MNPDEELPFKVGAHQRHDGIVEFRYANTYEIQNDGDRPRILIAPAEGHVDLLLRMLRELPEPLSLMYVLLASHTGVEPGRYWMADLTEEQVRFFLTDFAPFFEGDARHHLWIASSDNSVLVYDQHNVIYAYGPIEQYESILRSRGLTEAPTEFPYPHIHTFRSSMDPYEDRLIHEFNWTYSPLLPEDDD